MQICQVLWIWHSYMMDICVLLSAMKNCFPIFLPRSWDICALSCTCLPELYILAPQYVASPFNEIQQNEYCGYLVFCVLLPCLGVQHRGSSFGMPSTYILKANLSYFLSNLYEKKNFVVLQLNRKIFLKFG